jgi:hypothetical protein
MALTVEADDKCIPVMDCNRKCGPPKEWPINMKIAVHRSCGVAGKITLEVNKKYWVLGSDGFKPGTIRLLDGQRQCPGWDASADKEAK